MIFCVAACSLRGNAIAILIFVITSASARACSTATVPALTCSASERPGAMGATERDCSYASTGGPGGITCTLSSSMISPSVDTLPRHPRGFDESVGELVGFIRQHAKLHPANFRPYDDLFDAERGWAKIKVEHQAAVANASSPASIIFR